MPRLVVRAPFDGPSRDALDDALTALGLQLTNIVAPTESEPGQWVYATRTADALVHLVEERRLGLRYFALAPGQDALCAALAAAVPCFDPSQLRAELAATADEVRRVELLL
ncbi:MAG: hypothetical protein HY908_08010, partial [Myxococcales bacterium]|nr:hypothetical protein [Myxococcales bacterium]